MKLVLLPGMDGTGLLFDPLLRVLPPHFIPLVIAYPRSAKWDYPELLSFVCERIPKQDDFVIVAESFSGPLGIGVAAIHPPRLKALVLCATFVSSPTVIPHHLSFLVRRTVMAAGSWPPFLRHYFVGAKAPPLFMKDFQEALGLASPDVLAARMRLVLRVNQRDALKKCKVPVLYLRGTKDKLVKRRSLDEMLAIRPEIEVSEIEGPHLLLQCQPEKCIKAIDQFLSRFV